jgi:rare lipoprotein A
MIMRVLFVSALALASAALVAAAPANAAWTCQGGEVACSAGHAKASAKATHRKASRSAKKAKYAYGKPRKAARHASARKSSRHAARKSARYASAKRTKRVYTGSHSMSGVASFYWQPQAVASGGRFNPNALTAAHKTLPFGTKVRVTHMGNGRSVTVTINDRGPYIRGRIIDLSRRAAGVIGMTGSGVARVSVAVVGS